MVHSSGVLIVLKDEIELVAFLRLLANGRKVIMLIEKWNFVDLEVIVLKNREDVVPLEFFEYQLELHIFWHGKDTIMQFRVIDTHPQQLVRLVKFFIDIFYHYCLN